VGYEQTAAGRRAKVYFFFHSLRAKKKKKRTNKQQQQQQQLRALSLFLRGIRASVNLHRFGTRHQRTTLPAPPLDQLGGVPQRAEALARVVLQRQDARRCSERRTRKHDTYTERRQSAWRVRAVRAEVEQHAVEHPPQQLAAEPNKQ
jgi:hypothetical protein